MCVHADLGSSPVPRVGQTSCLPGFRAAQTFTGLPGSDENHVRGLPFWNREETLKGSEMSRGSINERVARQHGAAPPFQTNVDAMAPGLQVGLLHDQHVVSGERRAELFNGQLAENVGPLEEPAGLLRDDLEACLERMVIGVRHVEAEHRRARILQAWRASS